MTKKTKKIWIIEKVNKLKQESYRDFIKRFKFFIKKYPELITMTLSNIFTMRIIGNKTHGDLAEIAIAEFINQYMYDFRSIHVGKDLYRAKSAEEDIKVVNEITKAEFSISLKAYGDGPLQLSTDKHSTMFKRLEKTGKGVEGQQVKAILEEQIFEDFKNINVLPLIYDEKKKRCNIMVFDYDKVSQNAVRIIKEGADKKGRIHPVYRFYDSDDDYICEVRYGDASANALQRGLWTNTKNALKFFDSLTNGWIDYSHNPVLVHLFSHALVSSSKGHEEALEAIKRDIKEIKNKSGLK